MIQRGVKLVILFSYFAARVVVVVGGGVFPHENIKAALQQSTEKVNNQIYFLMLGSFSPD